MGPGRERPGSASASGGTLPPPGLPSCPPAPRAAGAGIISVIGTWTDGSPKPGGARPTGSTGSGPQSRGCLAVAQPHREVTQGPAGLRPWGHTRMPPARAQEPQTRTAARSWRHEERPTHHTQKTAGPCGAPHQASRALPTTGVGTRQAARLRHFIALNVSRLIQDPLISQDGMTHSGSLAPAGSRVTVLAPEIQLPQEDTHTHACPA